MGQATKTRYPPYRILFFWIDGGQQKHVTHPTGYYFFWIDGGQQKTVTHPTGYYFFG